MPARAAIIHGSGGSPERNWFPWLKGELAHRSIPAVVPRFPTPQGQNLESWLRVFEREVGEITPDLLLFGHSIGAAMVLNVLQRCDNKAKGCFLVAGFLGALNHSVFDPLNSSFFAYEFEWGKIRANAGMVYVYNGDNDPYVPLEKGQELARKLKTELSVIEGGGHLNQDSGFTAFPRLIRDLDSLLPSAQPGDHKL